ALRYSLFPYTTLFRSCSSCPPGYWLLLQPILSCKVPGRQSSVNDCSCLAVVIEVAEWKRRTQLTLAYDNLSLNEDGTALAQPRQIGIAHVWTPVTVAS